MPVLIEQYSNLTDDVMFNLNDYLQQEPVALTRDVVFETSLLSPVIVEWKHPHPVYGLHSHVDFEEFSIIRQGIGIHFSDNKFQLLAPGDAMFIGSESPHGYVCTHKMGLCNVVFTAEHFYSKFPEVRHLLNEIKLINSKCDHFSLSSESLKESLSIMQRIEYEHSHDMDDLIFATMFSLFLQITIILLRDNSDKYRGKLSLEKVRGYSNENIRLKVLLSIIKEIRDHSSENIKDITQALTISNLNTKTVQRYFFQYTKVSIHKFILLQKMVDTMNKIIEYPKINITEIIELSQYGSYRTFARQTNSFFCLSPKDFHMNVLAISSLKERLSSLKSNL